MKKEEFFIILQGSSLKQLKQLILEGKSATLRDKSSSQISKGISDTGNKTSVSL